MRHATPLRAAALLFCSLPATVRADLVQPCPSVGVAGLRITVVDSLSTQPAVVGAIVKAFANGTLIDSIQVKPPTTQTDVALLVERTGTFDVMVQQSGYHEWQQNNLVVKPGRCGPETERLTARLQRKP